MFLEIKKRFDEYWAYQWRIERRHKIPGIFEWDQKLVTLIEKSCNLNPRMKILDLGCGGGDQLKVFSERGYSVTGIDIASSLADFAKKQLQLNSLAGEIRCMDMRNINYCEEYDACVLLSFTFGFFMDEGDQELLYKINNALAVGGHVFIMYMSPRESKRTRTWENINGGYALNEEWYDSERCTYCSNNFHVMSDGSIIIPADDDVYNANEIIRCYTVPEMKRMLKSAGFGEMTFMSHNNVTNPNHQPSPEERLNIVADSTQTLKNDLNIAIRAALAGAVYNEKMQPLERMVYFLIYIKMDGNGNCIAYAITNLILKNKELWQ